MLYFSFTLTETTKMHSCKSIIGLLYSADTAKCNLSGTAMTVRNIILYMGEFNNSNGILVKKNKKNEKMISLTGKRRK